MSVNLGQRSLNGLEQDDEQFVGELPALHAVSQSDPELPVVNEVLPIERRLKKGAAWVLLARTSGIGVTMLCNIALARWLAPDAFGSFLLLSSLLALGAMLAMLGLNAAVIRFVSHSLGEGDFDAARQALRMIITVAVVGITAVSGLTAIVLSYTDTGFLGLPSAPLLIPLVIAGLACLALLQFIAEAFRSLHELRLASLFSGGQTGGLLSNVLFLVILAVAIVAIQPSFLTAVGLYVATLAICLPFAAFGLVSAVRANLGAAGRQPHRPVLTVRQLLAFSIPMLLIQLLTFATTQSDLWIAGICCPHDQLALYGSARRLMLVVTMPLQMANLTVISSIAELYGQQRINDLERVLRGASSVAAWPSICAIILLIFAGAPILDLLFGPYFRQAAVPLGILGMGQLFLVCAGGCGCALEMTGHQLGSLVINFVAAVAMAVVGTLAARQFGILGLSVASSVIIAAQSIALWLLAKKLVGVWTHPSLWPSFALEGAPAKQ